MYSNIFFDPPDYEMVCFELNDMLEAVWTFTEFKAWIFLLFLGELIWENGKMLKEMQVTWKKFVEGEDVWDRKRKLGRV